MSQPQIDTDSEQGNIVMKSNDYFYLAKKPRMATAGDNASAKHGLPIQAAAILVMAILNSMIALDLGIRAELDLLGVTLTYGMMLLPPEALGTLVKLNIMAISTLR